MAAVAPLSIQVATGSWGRVVCVVRENGTSPAWKFLATDCRQIRAKDKGKPQSTAEARFQAIFSRMAEEGRVLGASFKHEQGKIFTFWHKVKDIHIRFPCFQDGQSWVLTHGFPKKTRTWDAGEFRRAEELMAEYWERKRAATGVNGQGGRR